MVTDPDRELMLRFQRGNVHAFELLFEKYRAPIFNFIYRMLDRDRGLAEDLLQEIFVKLYRAKDFYEPRSKFSTWLFAITRNHCLNFIKSRRYIEGRNTMSLDRANDERGQCLLEKLPAGKGALSDLEKKEMQETLENAICTLPNGYKDIFLLHAVDGLAHREVAEILEMNPATVRTQYHRARQMLIERIGGIFNDEGRKSNEL